MASFRPHSSQPRPVKAPVWSGRGKTSSKYNKGQSITVYPERSGADPYANINKLMEKAAADSWEKPYGSSFLLVIAKVIAKSIKAKTRYAVGEMIRSMMLDREHLGYRVYAKEFMAQAK